MKVEIELLNDPFDGVVGGDRGDRIRLPNGNVVAACDWHIDTLTLMPGQPVTMSNWEEWLLVKAALTVMETYGVAGEYVGLVSGREWKEGSRVLLRVPAVQCLGEGFRLRPTIHLGGMESVFNRSPFTVDYLGLHKVVTP